MVDKRNAHDQFALYNTADSDVREDASLDPNAGGTYGNKPIWDVTTIDANLNRTGYSWYLDNYHELDDGVLNYGFWLNPEELANSYYVNVDGTVAFSEYFGFTAFTEGQTALARHTIGLWDDLIAISFRETKSGSADITYGNTDTGGAQAYAYLPFGSSGDAAYEAATGFEDVGRLGGDVWIDGNVPSNFFPLDNSYYAALTSIHETGHALGLSHPGDYDALNDDDGDGVPDPISYANNADFAQDSLQYTVMSYFDAYETGAQHIDWSLLNFAYASTPLVHDISAIQAIYGADYTTRAGNTVYGFHSTAGKDVYDFTVNTRPIIAIWDGGGKDTLDLSGYATPSTINLNEGAFSSAGGIDHFLTLDEVNANRVALGFAPRSQDAFDYYEDLRTQLGVTSPLFTDNISIAYGAVIENAIGGSGSDTIIANQVANIIDGGAGNDLVSYETATQRVVVSLETGRGAVGAVGDRLISIESLTGSSFSDVLAGNTGKNRLDGGLGDDRLSGGGGSDLFYFHTNVASGRDRISDFSSDDVIMTDKKIFDRGNDGVIELNAGGAVIIDRADSDRLILDGVDHASGIRYLGEDNGRFFYGETAARPIAGANEAVFEGLIGNDRIFGSASDAVTDVFFYDTAGRVSTSGDDIITFTAKDLFVTTTQLATDRPDGIIYFPDAELDLTGHGGTVQLRNSNGLVNALEYDGVVQHDGLNYFVYSALDSVAGTADLHFIGDLPA